jgi:hypothetical protein
MDINEKLALEWHAEQAAALATPSTINLGAGPLYLGGVLVGQATDIVITGIPGVPLF